MKENVEGIQAEMNKRGQESCSQSVAGGLPAGGPALQRDAAAAYAHPEVQPPRRSARLAEPSDPMLSQAWSRSSQGTSVDRMGWVDPFYPTRGPERFGDCVEGTIQLESGPDRGHSLTLQVSRQNWESSGSPLLSGGRGLKPPSLLAQLCPCMTSLCMKWSLSEEI